MKPCNPILREIDYRTELPRFLNDYNLLGSFAEVGVFVGDFSKTILATWKGSELILVDPYKEYDRSTYFDSTQDRDQEEVYRQAQNNVAPWIGRYVFMRMESMEAASLLPDGSLSGCFLDGNHSYEASSADIAAWYPKVKSGGLFSGHDFYTRLKDTNSDALNSVLDFAESIDTRPHVTWCNSWWFIKP